MLREILLEKEHEAEAIGVGVIRFTLRLATMLCFFFSLFSLTNVTGHRLRMGVGGYWAMMVVEVVLYG